MNPLEGVSTKDLMHELQRRKGLGVDFVFVPNDIPYRIDGIRNTLQGTGPAVLIEVML